MTSTLSGQGGGRGDSVAELAEDRLRAAVRALRSARNISLATLVDELGTSKASMSRKLNGQASFSAGEVAVLADLFSVPIGSLYSGRLDLATGPRAVPDPTPPGIDDAERIKGSWYTVHLSEPLIHIPAPRGSVENLSPVDLAHESHPTHASAA